MTIVRKFTAAALLGAMAFGPATANVPAAKRAMTVKEIPLNFESGSTGEPITIYRHKGELAFVVIDSVAGSKDYRINIGSIASIDGKTRSLGAYLPLRNGEGVTVQLAKDSTLKLRAHVVLVSGYLNG
ncbi:MAG: hypothetical protein U1E93_08285 [Alphaproteobacteria bacterium]